MYPQLSKEVAANEALVVMNTSLGSIKIKFFRNKLQRQWKTF